MSCTATATATTTASATTSACTVAALITITTTTDIGTGTGPGVPTGTHPASAIIPLYFSSGFKQVGNAVTITVPYIVAITAIAAVVFDHFVA
jgi:hypothetical protein